MFTAEVPENRFTAHTSGYTAPVSMVGDYCQLRGTGHFANRLAVARRLFAVLMMLAAPAYGEREFEQESSAYGAPLELVITPTVHFEPDVDFMLPPVFPGEVEASDDQLQSLPPPQEVESLGSSLEELPPVQADVYDGAVHYRFDESCSEHASCLSPYLSRAAQTASQALISTDAGPSAELQEVSSPWWQPRVVHPLFPDGNHRSVGVLELIFDALRYSPSIRAISQTPLIREYTIYEADAEFDVTAFMESKFLDLSEPVGSDLTTGVGGPSRFRDHDWDYSAGLRRKMRTGASVEMSQDFGYQDNNSNFFNPTQQGTARLSLRFTQPLLHGRGRLYNTGLTVLAEIDSRVAWDQFSEELQDHLLEVTAAYWRLYYGRASVLQRRRHYERAKTILDELEARRGIDSTEAQVALARAAVEARTTDILRAETTIRDAQTRIRALVTSPDLIHQSHQELIPRETPKSTHLPVNPRDALLTALQHRPDVDDAIQQIQAASVRLNLAENELMPLLNVVVESYVSGLRGESNVGGAWRDQFAVGEPTYSAGLVFEVPLGNRAAVNRHNRRRLELRQMVDQFQSRVETLMAEVEIAVRQVNMLSQELINTYRAHYAAGRELYALQERWNVMAGDGQTASLLLEDLLNSQDRLANAEQRFLNAQIDYTMSFAQLNRTMGTLFVCDQFSTSRICECGLPRLEFVGPKGKELSGEIYESKIIAPNEGTLR